MAAFSKGDRVAWSQAFATALGAGAVVHKDAAQALDPAAKLGKVVGPTNDEKTYYEVEFEDGKHRILTDDELVKVA